MKKANPILEAEARLVLAVEDLKQAVAEAKRVGDGVAVEQFIQLQFATQCQLESWRQNHPASKNIGIVGMVQD